MIRRVCLVVAICLLGVSLTTRAQHQVADDTWQPDTASPAFPADSGPRILVDAAHGNWHTIDGRFRGFAKLARADGYRVASATETLSPTLFESADLFVIANAVKDGENSEWVLPTPPAFESSEALALERWVTDGGSLLLIADHMPFPGSMAIVAEQFGIVFYNGYAKPAPDRGSFLDFTRSSGALADHVITRGRSASERVESVRSFTGQGFRATRPVEPLMWLPRDWNIYLPRDAMDQPFDRAMPFVPATGLLQGAVFRHGRGRVAVFGEAAMFTTQVIQHNGHTIRFGMNHPDAAGNAQFVLNVLHWLSGQLDD